MFFPIYLSLAAGNTIFNSELVGFAIKFIFSSI
nr:MAG TPA: hypothetical protein [Caudoviricetes sp.]